MLTFHILNVYVDKTQPHQFKFTFKAHYSIDVGNKFKIYLLLTDMLMNACLNSDALLMYIECRHIYTFMKVT